MKRVTGFTNTLIFGALCLFAVSCAHEPESTLADESSASSGTGPASVAAASEEDKGALENETRQMLNQEVGSTVADTASAASAQGEDNTPPDVAVSEKTVAPLIDPLASMNPSSDVASAKPAAIEAPVTAVIEVVPVVVAQLAETPKADVTVPAPAPVVKKHHRARQHKVATQLNRYYFLRTGDTPEYLSKLFFGTPEKAEQIVGWNQPRENWQPGKVIYYRSPVQSADRKMRSYYEEKQVAVESYVTKAGDSLARLAQEKYGNSLSSREIAAINDLRTDTALPVGKKLKLYLVGDAKPVVNAKSDAEMIKAEIAKVESETAKSAPASKVAVAAVAVPVPQPVAPDHEKAKLASMEITNFARQNPIVVAGLGALLILLGSYFVAARKRTRSRLDF